VIEHVANDARVGGGRCGSARDAKIRADGAPVAVLANAGSVWRQAAETGYDPLKRGGGSSTMYTLIGIGLLVAVALVSNKEQRKGAWLLAAVVIVLVAISDRFH
jgi:hypothetical protein